MIFPRYCKQENCEVALGEMQGFVYSSNPSPTNDDNIEVVYGTRGVGFAFKGAGSWEKSEMLEIDRKFLSRSLNEGFS